MPKIKICGLFRDCDISAVNEAKPDYIGFVFAQSRRGVTPEQAQSMRHRLSGDIRCVGVFTDASVSDIARLYRDGTIDIAQLHGHETELYITDLKQLCGIPVIKALRVDSAEDILCCQTTEADWLLLDSGGGGTGKVFDWSIIPETKKPFFLAGGISEDNIANALTYKPFGVDISSGAETDGVKDRQKILRLVCTVRGR